MKAKTNTSRRKFVIIAKVNDYGAWTFVKYRTNHIEKTLQFINTKFNYTLAYANIYSNRGENIREQIGSYGKKKGLEISSPNFNAR